MEQENKKQELENKVKILDRVKKTLYARINDFDKDQQEMLKQLQELDQQEKKDYKNYLEGLDEEFETHTKDRIKETPLLFSLFNDFVQHIYKPSKMYWLASKTKSIIDDELRNTLDNEQKDLLEQWQFCEDRMLDDMVEQAFIYGYAMSVQFREEAVQQYPIKK